MEPARLPLLLTRCRGVPLNFAFSIVWKHKYNTGWYHLGLWWQFSPVHCALPLAAHLHLSTCLGLWRLSHSWGLRAWAHCLNQPGTHWDDLYRKKTKRSITAKLPAYQIGLHRLSSTVRIKNTLYLGFPPSPKSLLNAALLLYSPGPPPKRKGGSG